MEEKMEKKSEETMEEKSAEKLEEKSEETAEEKSVEKLEEKSEETTEEKAVEKSEEKPEEQPEENNENNENTNTKSSSKVKKWASCIFLEKRGWIPHVVIAIVVIGCAAVWLYSRPRFHDLTVELGTENISIEDFMTEFANAKNAGIVTDLSTVDISSVGSFPLTLRSGSRNETVTLTVEDTTPPEVEFIPKLEKTPDYQPDPYDFVASCYDLSQVNAYFVGNVVVPLNYEDQSFTVVVEDASGNAVSRVCTLSIVWLKSEYTLELGEQLSKEDLLFNPQRDDYRINQDEIDAINQSGIGEYTVASLVDETVCQIQVVDTTPPELVLTDLSIYQGEKVTLDSFVESYYDASGDVQLCLMSQLDVDTLGMQTITIEATDINGNTTTSTATLAVVEDKTPPVIKGLSTLTVAKRSNPDYLAGVTAVDKVDGACEVSYDSRGVDLTTAGTYYVTYTSKDKDGNTAKVKRTVVVEHDKEDTEALADSIAAGLSSDPEEIRDYVRNTVKYSHNRDEEDPVWYGFTNKNGDCYVHAICLQSILSRKGYETQLIWVTNKTHYWLIINLDGVWRHIDATPGPTHSKYSLMTDDLRYSTLGGRNWDRSAWPKCE
ncbi:MAG: DUF5011 domain-containing protein [Acetatifactor sp.]|nr:DUF5011 domain-containing protein [Acetatifactor sp.]